MSIVKSLQEISEWLGRPTTASSLDDLIGGIARLWPFGVKKQTVEICEKKTATLTVESGETPSGYILVYTSGKLGFTTEFTSDCKYTVILNGVKYENVKVVNGCLNEDSPSNYCENNDDYTIPANYWSIRGNGYFFASADGYNGAKEVTVEIYAEQETVKQLDYKFMPEPIVFTTADMQTVTCNKSYEECLKLYQNKVFNAVVDVGIGIYPMTSYMYINDESGEDLCYMLTTSDSQMVIEYSKTGEITIQAINNG